LPEQLVLHRQQQYDAWLENRGYVKAARLEYSVFILVHITRAGIDVAQGNTRAEGIDPPPEE
jgi:hypothetical protein